MDPDPDPTPDLTPFFSANFFSFFQALFFSSLNTFMRKGKDLDPDPDPYLYKIRIRDAQNMRIRVDPQHCTEPSRYLGKRWSILTISAEKGENKINCEWWPE
jgi:hypothetical protein